MFGALSQSLAVDNHRAGQHQPGHPGTRHCGEQYRRAVHVGGGVVGQILHVHSEADLRREMAHGVDTEAAPAQLSPCRGHRQHRLVLHGVRGLRVENDRVVPARNELVAHVAADESVAAGQ